MKILTALIVIAAPLGQTQEVTFSPERISKCASIELNGSIAKVFPLVGPILEKEWAYGWDPEIIYSATGIVEEHMIFRTKAHHAPEDFYTWVITQFSPDKYNIEYTVSTPNRIWFISVQCISAGQKTKATVCYTYTGLNDLGNQLNRALSEKMFADDLKDWEEALNYYLTNDKLLKP